MFNAVHCRLVRYSPCGVQTTFTYEPEGIPQPFTAWGRFSAFQDSTEVVTELASACEGLGRYTQTRWRSAKPPTTLDRSRLHR